MWESPSEEFKHEICAKFNTSPQQVKKDVEVLKEWIRQQPHLPQNQSDILLTNFLIASKNSMERAKERIDNYYTVRQQIPEFYGDRDLDEERTHAVSKEIRIIHLPKYTPDGCRVTMCSIITGDANKYDLEPYTKRLFASIDVMLNMVGYSMGEYMVFDGHMFTAAHLLRITPTLARNMLHCVQDAIPVIVKGVIIINSPVYVQLAVNVIKPFAKAKLFERIHIHTEGPDVLEKYFPRKMIPSDYGGEEDTRDIMHERWVNFLREKRDWLMTEGAVTVDEKKRIGGSSTKKGLGFEELQGSFKALCVD